MSKFESTVNASIATRERYIKQGLIHKGPMSFPVGHPMRNDGPTIPRGTRSLNADQLETLGFIDAAASKRARILNMQEQPTFYRT